MYVKLEFELNFEVVVNDVHVLPPIPPYTPSPLPSLFTSWLQCSNLINFALVYVSWSSLLWGCSEFSVMGSERDGKMCYVEQFTMKKKEVNFKGQLKILCVVFRGER